jgi:acetyl-CoA acetyltransferase
VTVGGHTAIVGIGATEFSKESGRSELRLAVEAISSALADAGLVPGDVSGFATMGIDTNEEVEIAKSLGTDDLRFFAQTPYGGGSGCGVVMLAQMAVACGQADVVVCYRAMNERSGVRFGQARTRPFNVRYGWSSPFGLLTAAAKGALLARRYMYDFGATSEDFGRVTVVERAYAATNPSAWFYEKPITLEDHQASRMIADPLRLLDCCQESDGAVAIVVTSLDRARDLKQPVVEIRAAAQAASWDQEVVTAYYRDTISDQPEMVLLAEQLFRKADIDRGDVDVANFYDHFTPLVLMQLEGFGYCGPGEAKDFVREGGLAIGGALPLNTNGGQLGEGYIHGFNGIAEAVRQVRGTAVNQVPGAAVALVTSGSSVPTSGMILAKA